MENPVGPGRLGPIRSCQIFFLLFVELWKNKKATNSAALNTVEMPLDLHIYKNNLCISHIYIIYIYIHDSCYAYVDPTQLPKWSGVGQPSRLAWKVLKATPQERSQKSESQSEAWVKHHRSGLFTRVLSKPLHIMLGFHGLSRAWLLQVVDNFYWKSH